MLHTQSSGYLVLAITNEKTGRLNSVDLFVYSISTPQLDGDNPPQPVDLVRT